MKKLIPFALLVASFMMTSFDDGGLKTSSQPGQGNKTPGGEVRLMTLDPGHFHAALVQKNMYDQISPEVFVFAPAGNDLNEHLKRIEGYNSRAEKPTAWKENVYTGSDYFQKMLKQKPGNVVVIAGNNRIKTDYIRKSVQAGLNVLADKPMVISPDKFGELEEAFKIAKQKKVLLYDIMTERYEITSILQKELSHIPAIFGKLLTGTPEKPAVEIVSVHYFYKEVSGKPNIRPGWYFDVDQQGEGIVDVTSHLVDLVQWGLFPEQILKKSDVEMISAKRWPTIISLKEFKDVTKLNAFPVYLKKDIKEGQLQAYANGQMTYKLKGVSVSITAEWKYKAPEGTGDTHFSVMHGTNCNLEIRQGKEENYIPALYIYANKETNLIALVNELEKAIEKNKTTTGLTIEKINPTTWRVNIPEKYKVGHEAHFGQVTEKFLGFLKDGKLPVWEVPNMITKYYTTTSALKMALHEENRSSIN